MDHFRADLHIHSRHSRATSRELAPRRLAAWAQVKGLGLIGTGDFTHPGWLAELDETLEEDGSGLLKLREPLKGLETEIGWLAGYPFHARTRFMLQAEISSIYKRGGKVRKVHSLVYLPGLDAVRRFNAKLGKVGNLASDGRPILGLDARDLLEIVLETDPRGFVIPAHIWTPWFSIFGSKSGFDSIEECYGDLAGEIFALETGLSSDPEMNWLWSKLDRFKLVSNSDAHSGEKLAREANLFEGQLSYDAVLRALKGVGVGARFLGTLEFFPEEGKYHLDGHRACKVVLDPRETKRLRGICPVCGKPLTVGVLSRVLELADRESPVRPDLAPGFISLIPLAELLSEVLDSGPTTKTVRTAYATVVSAVGSELSVLMDAAPDDLDRLVPLLGEAVRRMRRGAVLRTSGYDGEFGIIHVFTPAEKRDRRRGGLLVDVPGAVKGAAEADDLPPPQLPAEPAERPMEFNAGQLAAIEAGLGEASHPVLVLAGPGTGKTQTLMGRVQRLLASGTPAERILAVTFSRRAAGELRERLGRLVPEGSPLPRAETLHALAFEALRGVQRSEPVLLDEDAARRLFAEANPELTGQGLARAWARVGLARERLAEEQLPEELATALGSYQVHKRRWQFFDYTDLLAEWLQRLEAGAEQPEGWDHLLVDEVQDLSRLQLTLLARLTPADGRGFFAIGDPKQAIYAFRGAEADAPAFLQAQWPELQTLALTDNYRSAAGILELAAPLFPQAPRLLAHQAEAADIQYFAAPSSGSEAIWIAERIRGLLGSTSATLAGLQDDAGTLAPGDIAVLVRLRELAEPIRKALDRLGLPVSVPEGEAFWNDARTRLILDIAAAHLGLLPLPAEAPELPDKVLARGPLGLAAYLEDIPPFDRFYWKGKAYRQLGQMFEAHGGWLGLLNHVHLQSEQELVKARAESVQIMTLHAAKGLEFEAVFLPGLEDGIVPFAGPEVLRGKPSAGEAPDGGEERRLFYVGLTRARRALYLSHATRRSLYGRELKLGASRFLAELPSEGMRSVRLVPKTVRQEEHLQLFRND